MIYLVWGKPKHGKTYYAVRWARSVMKHKSKTVYTNFPLVTEWGCSKQWKPEYAAHNIQNSLIIIDEAYMDFNSRNYAKFTKQEHAFFSLNGHNGNDIVVIAHSPARLDTVIREMCNEFLYVDCVYFPLTYRALWFKVEAYLDEQAISMRYVQKGTVYYIKRYPFSWAVARSYDYKFYRHDTAVNPDDYPTWDKVLPINKEGYKKVKKSILRRVFPYYLRNPFNGNRISQYSILEDLFTFRFLYSIIFLPLFLIAVMLSLFSVPIKILKRGKKQKHKIQKKCKNVTKHCLLEESHIYIDNIYCIDKSFIFEISSECDFSHSVKFLYNFKMPEN